MLFVDNKENTECHRLYRDIDNIDSFWWDLGVTNAADTEF